MAGQQHKSGEDVTALMGGSGEDVTALMNPAVSHQLSPKPTQDGMSNEDWAGLSGGEKMRNVLQWSGKALGGAFFGPAGVEAAEHPTMTLATAAIPLAARKIINLVPRTGRASAKFQDVMSVAKDAPVNMENAGQVALRIQQLSERGGAMPKAARDLLRRVTDPERPPVGYGEIRDFASNIGRVSADESRRLTPVIRREMGNLHAATNTAAQDAAASVGKGAEHAAAMKEYAQAMKMKQLLSTLLEGAKHTVPYATAAGAGAWLAKKLSGASK
jgi:hypothetical protein